MSKIAIITNPSHDIATEYMGAWSEKLILKKYQHLGIVELKKEEVTELNLTKAIRKENPKFVILNGHGNKREIFGYDFQSLIKAGKNEYLLKDTIIHALACSAGEVLGPKIISNGGISYIGYKENFKAACSFVRTTSAQQKDPLAKLFFEPAFLAVSQILEGKTAGEAYRNSNKMYLENLRKAVANPDPAYNEFAVSRLYHNITHQVCLGDELATI